MSTVIWIGTDEHACRIAAAHLEAVEFELDTAHDMPGALRLVYERRPDAVIVDSRLTDMDGVEFTHLLRAIANQLAIVMVSDAGDPQSIVAALDQGADDYITKPFGATELVARVRAAIRRAARAQLPLRPNRVMRTELVFDREARTVTKGSNVVHLNPTEFQLLESLASRFEKVAS